jgi:hypothetical protein
MGYRIAPEDGRGGRGFLAISFLPDPRCTFFLRTDDESRRKGAQKNRWPAQTYEDWARWGKPWAVLGDWTGESVKKAGELLPG